MPGGTNRENVSTDQVQDRVEKTKKRSKSFKSKFDYSLHVLYKKEREKRLPTLVQIRKAERDKFYGLSNNQKRRLKGTYAFVTLTEDETLAWPKSEDKHNDTCHFALANFAPTLLFAGEVKFNPLTASSEFSTCEMFNNASGTYKPEAQYMEQSGFPPESFVAPTFSY